MASKRKTATKKTSKKATRHKARRKGATPLASATKGIGVVSSIEYPPFFRRKFKKGVKRVVDPNLKVKIKYRHVLGYKSDDLTRLTAEITKFNADTEIDLIVTVGGLAAYQAASDYDAAHGNAKKFVSLVGDTPTNPPTKFLGGVSLRSWQANPDRINHLINDKNHSKGDICLFYNKNSKMQAVETANWPQTASPPVSGGNDASGNNDSSTYKADFSRIPSNVTAVVISADPFFQDTMDDLIDAANDWVGGSTNRYVVYPVLDYENGDPPPMKDKTTLLGPDLSDAYQQIGQQAGSALSGNNVNVVPTIDHIKELH